jgi:hypothetical protein
MLHLETVDAGTLGLLKWLQGHPVFAETRLVGGTALALQLGHRKSIDLDVFGHLSVGALELEQTLREYGPVSVAGRSRMIQAYAVCGIKVDVVEYSYPWLDGPVAEDGVRLASFRDIAAMKLAAITNRGTRKDFVDLAFLLDRFSLDEMLVFYREKYGDASLFPVIKSLAYFDDADEDPMPNMLMPCDWGRMKRGIVRSVAQIGLAG